MHGILFAASLAVSLFVSTPVAAQEILSIPSERVYVPGGFDDNDNIQIVLDGQMQMSCDRLMAAKWELDEVSKQIFISARVIRDHTASCFVDPIPFTQVIDLGILPKGQYRIWTNEGRLIKTLFVEEARSAGPDDVTYAHLTHFDIEHDTNNVDDFGSWSIVLEGFYENTCQQWDYVEVIVSSFMFEVLPVITTTGDHCLTQFERFTKRVPLPKINAMGRYLIHARSAEGEAINQIFTVTEVE